MPKAAQVLSVHEIELGERLIAAMTLAPWRPSLHEFRHALTDEWGVYPPQGKEGPVALVPGQDIAEGIVWLRNNAEVLLAAARVVRVSVCTKCGWTGIPNVFPVTHQTYPLHTDLQYGCGREGCGYQVSPPLSAFVEALTLERDRLRGALHAPVPLILHCPECRIQHVDVDDDTGAWATSRLHRTHLCKPSDGGCGLKFKPANQATVGVRELPEPVNG